MPARRTPAKKAAPKRAGRRQPDARPDEILDAALDIFSSRGFDAARMEEIAARAAISKAGVYLYFPSKEALLDALIEREIVGSSRVDLQACKLEYSIVSPK